MYNFILQIYVIILLSENIFFSYDYQRFTNLLKNIRKNIWIIFIFLCIFAIEK